MNIRLGCIITNHAGQQFRVVAYTVSVDNPQTRIYKAVELGRPESNGCMFYTCDQYGNGWEQGVIHSVDWDSSSGGENVEPPICREEIAAVRKAVDELAIAIGISAHRIPDKVPAMLNTCCVIPKPMADKMDMLVKMNDGSVNVKELAAKLKALERKNG